MKKNNLIFFSATFFLLVCKTVVAEVTLPVCEGVDSFKWNNCLGAEKKSIAYDQLYKKQYKNKKPDQLDISGGQRKSIYLSRICVPIPCWVKISNRSACLILPSII